MELTKDYLLEHGFETNHPEYILARCYKASKTKPEWRINVESEYIPLTNQLAFNISCWRCNESGAIVKRTSVSYATTAEELYDAIKLCGIFELDGTLKNIFIKDLFKNEK